MSTTTAPSIQQWTSTLQEAQKNAAEGAKREFAKDYSGAFALYVRAGESYIWLARTFDDFKRPGTGSAQAALIDALPVGGELSDAKGRIRNAADKVLRRAQLIKQLRSDIRPVARRVTGQEEQARALRSYEKLNGIKIPLWQGEPGPSTFSGALFTSSPESTPVLSPAHVTRRATYRRRSEGLKWSETDLCCQSQTLGGQQIVQDLVNDCSFVAALEVAAEHDKRYKTNLAHSALYPKDSNEKPTWSQNGRHLVRLRINGADRCIEIDDRLPCDEYNTPLCAVGLAEMQISPELLTLSLWPALVEKAFLSLHGGYDFGGSNSAADLHALIGWIPEDCGFRRADFQREKRWRQLFSAFNAGKVMITAGTGKDASHSSTSSGATLVDLHNYAILDMTETAHGRVITLMNPWRRLPPQDPHRAHLEDGEGLSSLTVTPNNGSELLSMSWDEACSRLDSLYLNWDPALYSYSDTLHAIWTPHKALSSPEAAEISNGRVQFQLDVRGTGSKSDEEVVLHLERHLTNQQRSKEVVWVALHAFERTTDGKEVIRMCANTFVDGMHTTLRYRATSGMHTIVASMQLDRSISPQNYTQPFTIKAYSNSRVSFAEADANFKTERVMQGRWASRSAGGNSLCHTFVHNPQYMVRNTSTASPSSSTLQLTVETSRDVATQILVVWGRNDAVKASDGEIIDYEHRVDSLGAGQIVCSSGDYSYGLAIAELQDFRVDTAYSLIVSTYLPGKEADFVLRMQSTAAKIDVNAVAAEGAGMHQQRFRGAWSVAHGTASGAPRYGRYRSNPTYRIIVTKAMKLAARLTVVSGTAKKGSRENDSHSIASRPPINLALLSSSSGAEVGSSGSYEDRICGVLFRRDKLEPGEYLLVVSTFEPDIGADYALQIHSERSVVVERLQ